MFAWLDMSTLSSHWTNWFVVVTTCFILPIYLLDLTLTTDSVAESIKLMNSWDSLKYTVAAFDIIGAIPGSRLREIQQRCSTKRDIAHECASYYIHCHPQPSWTHLASHLYSKGEFAAVEKLKPFLPLRGTCNSKLLHYANMIITIILCVCASVR